MFKPIYLDYNATTPIAAEVADAMRPFLVDYFGNPSSNHLFGKKTKTAIETSRQQVAQLLGCSPEEVVFTSGATESNNMAIKGASFANRNKGNHIITSAVEHPAVLEVCRFLKQNGFELTILPVDSFGRVDVNEVERALKPTTILITMMHANNEVGTLQPISEIGKLAKNRGIVFHTDAAQSVGKIKVDVQELGVDLLSVAGHKFYAPKGIGALYIKKGTLLEKFMHGASHEKNLRAGTENILEIVGLGKAAEIAHRDLEKNYLHLSQTRDRLWKQFAGCIPDLFKNNHPIDCLPNTLSMGFNGIDAQWLINQLPQIAFSAGSACHSNGVTISSVLQAMNLDESLAKSTIRLSTGRETTFDEIDLAVQEFEKVYRYFRK